MRLVFGISLLSLALLACSGSGATSSPGGKGGPTGGSGGTGGGVRHHPGGQMQTVCIIKFFDRVAFFIYHLLINIYEKGF